jgi:hypothetical protein
MAHLRQRATERHETEDPFKEDVEVLVINEGTSTSILNSVSFPAPSPLVEVSNIPEYTEGSPDFNFPIFSYSPTRSAEGYTSTRTATSVTGPRITIPLFGWVMLMLSATLALISVVLLISILISDCRHQIWDGRTEKNDRFDDKRKNAIPRMIVVSYRAPPEGYGRLETEEPYLKGRSITDNVPKATQFRTQKLQRSFERHAESGYRLQTHLTTIPEDRSLGDLCTLCDEDCIFED